MKTIKFGNASSNGHVPFWQPWGCMGCLWRFLLFLLLLLVLLLLLSLLKTCDNKEELPKEFKQPADSTFIQPDSIPQEGIPADSSWNRPIEDAEKVGLPSPRENTPPPFDERETIPNPENGGITDIYGNMLYVIFDSDVEAGADEIFRTFASKFSSLYPQPVHRIQYYNTGAKTAVLIVPPEKRVEIMENLPRQIPEVKFLVVPIEVMMSNATATPNDPVFKYPELSWYFEPIQAPEAWTITRGSENVIVGIVDSYMDISHSELRGDRVLYPYSVIRGDANVAPPVGAPMNDASTFHGTFVTALAVGTANNGVGSSGIAPECKYIPVSMGKTINTFTMVEGLLYCIHHGADVVNLSCGTYFDEDMLKQMPVDQQIAFSRQSGRAQELMWDYVFKLADERNVTIVWSAGNQNIYGAMDTSKRSMGTIRVSAVDPDLRKADFSNFGNFSDRNIYHSTISAPGADIFSAQPCDTYGKGDGTSYSAPIVTGAVALMKSINGNLTNKEIIQILQETGKPVEGAPEIGKLLQIKDALLKIKSQFGRFNDNLDKMVGTWETTKTLTFTDQETGIITGKGKIRIQILPNGSAKVMFFQNGFDGVFTAPATVKSRAGQVTVTQTQMATAPNSDAPFVRHTFFIRPDHENKTFCTCRSESGGQDECYLRKLN